MESSHVRPASAHLASAWCALCRLPAAEPWFWLVRSGAPGGLAAKIIQAGAHAPDTAPAIGLLLLHELPRLLVALGKGALGHG